MINVEELVGMSERSAVRKIENARYIARVISRDGVERVVLTEDHSEDRINLICVDGLVTKAWIG
ncbi:hypothetical protein EBU71_23115 [bacterium]|jgi:hydroxymethylpyrimidine/phosphomethylpyrimidine kinase|nr:hypothetical protein [Candidatus Elulimicrobium humile]